MRWGVGLAVALLLGSLLGAYVGGDAVGACTVGPAGGPAGSCDTDVRLSGTGAAVGALIVALGAAWLLTRRRRKSGQNLSMSISPLP
jgi:hypothetical protein